MIQFIPLENIYLTVSHTEDITFLNAVANPSKPIFQRAIPPVISPVTRLIPHSKAHLIRSHPIRTIPLIAVNAPEKYSFTVFHHRRIDPPIIVKAPPNMFFISSHIPAHIVSQAWPAALQFQVIRFKNIDIAPPIISIARPKTPFMISQAPDIIIMIALNWLEKYPPIRVKNAIT